MGQHNNSRTTRRGKSTEKGESESEKSRTAIEEATREGKKPAQVLCAALVLIAAYGARAVVFRCRGGLPNGPSRSELWGRLRGEVRRRGPGEALGAGHEVQDNRTNDWGDPFQ